MNQAKLQKACKDRGLSEKGSKDDLLARLRDAFKIESETQSAPQAAEPAKKDTNKSKKDPKSKESEKSSKTKSSSGSTVTAASKILSAESIMISEFIDKIQLVRKYHREESQLIVHLDQLDLFLDFSHLSQDVCQTELRLSRIERTDFESLHQLGL